MPTEQQKSVARRKDLETANKAADYISRKNSFFLIVVEEKQVRNTEIVNGPWLRWERSSLLHCVWKVPSK